jgi:hypothetical protein
MFDSDLRGTHVDEEGLLTISDVERAEQEAFGDLSRD